MVNFIRLRCLSPFHYRFIFLDTKDYVSARLFAASGVHIARIKVMIKFGSPFRLITCRIRKGDLSEFTEIMEQLRNNVMILGYRDYDRMCIYLNEAEDTIGKEKEYGKQTDIGGRSVLQP